MVLTPRRFSAALLLVALVTPAVAAPPPEPLCGPCDGFEAAAADDGLGVDLERATATVTLAENGSAAWTVRLRVGEAAARTFAADPERRQAVAREAVVGRGVPSLTEPVGLSTSVTGETVVVRFRDPDATDREAGLFVAEFLRPDGRLTAGTVDRITLRGPPGTALLAGGDVVGVVDDTDEAGGVGETGDAAETVVLYDTDTSTGDVSRLDDSVIVFGSPDTAWGVPTLAVAATVVPPWLDTLRQFGWLPAGVGVASASGLAALVGWLGRREWDQTTVGRQFTVLTAAVSVPAVALVVWGSAPVALLAALASYGVVGVTAWHRPRAFRSPVETAAVTAAAALAAFGVVVVWHGEPIDAVQTVGRIAPVVLAPAVGATGRRFAAAGIGTAGAILVVASAFGPDTAGLAVVVVSVVVAVVVALAVPPATVTRVTTRQRPDEQTTRQRPDERS